MAITIYLRERIKVGKGTKQPRFRVIAVSSNDDEDVQFELLSVHFRKVEIEQIAKEIGAKLVFLKPIPESERGKKNQ